MNKRATENYILMFLTVSSLSSDSIVKGIVDDIINTLRSKSKDWFARNTNNVSDWRDMSSHRLLFQ
jgi:hypothetical protein